MRQAFFNRGFPSKALLSEEMNRLRGWGSSGNLKLTGPLVTNTDSQIFRGEGSVYPSPVAVKLFRKQNKQIQEENFARAYFAALKEWQYLDLGNSRFELLRAFDIFDEINAIVVEWVEGDSVSRALKGVAAGDKCEILGRAGEWIGRLHCNTFEFNAPVKAAEMLADSRAEVAQTRFATHSTILIAVEELSRSVDRIVSHTTAWCNVHGDFKPDNLIVSNDRMVGIDLGRRGTGPGIADLAHFLNHVATLLRSPAMVTFLPKEEILENHFLEAYAKCTHDVCMDLLLWVRLQNALRLICNLPHWSQAPRSLYTEYVARLLIKNLVARLRKHRKETVTLPYCNK